MIFSLQVLPPAQAVYLMVVAAVLGACFGSFINNVAWRMVRGATAFKGRSKCSKCEHTLGILDLVPIFSWLFLRGKCRYCKAKISPRYVLVELVMAVLFAAILWQWGLSIQALAYALLATILCGLTLVDFETKTIPNGFILGGIVLWVASVWFISVSPGIISVGSTFAGIFGYTFWAVLIDGLVGGIAIGGGMLVCSLLFDKITGRNSLGGGDIKLFFMVGLFLGLPASLFNLMLSCILGLVFSFVWALLQKGSSDIKADEASVSSAEISEKPQESFKTKAFPFGPAIAVATMVTLFIGPQFLSWYVGLL